MNPRCCEFINDWRPRPSCALLSQTKAELVEYVGIGTPGRQKNDLNGKAAYVALIEWANRALKDRFSNAMVSAVRPRYRRDLEER